MSRDPSVDINAVMISGALAFLLGFLDFITLSGFLVYALIVIGLNYFGHDPSKWYQIVFLGLLMPLNFIYHIVFESSPVAATPGKRLFRLKWRDTAGERPRFSKLVVRHLSKTLSALALLFPILHLALGNRRQCLHDRIAGVCVHETSASDTEIASVRDPGTALLDLECASLWRRIPAAILDSVTFDCILTVVFCICFLACAYVIPAPFNQTEAIVGYGIGAGLSSLLAVAAAVTTMARCESGGLQTTPGKFVMGLMVTDTAMKRVGYRGAIYKQLMQGMVYFSLFPFFYIAAGITAFLSLRQSSEQFPYYALVLFVLIFGIYGLTICATFFKNRRTLLDVVCRRLVFVESKFREHESKKFCGSNVSLEVSRIQNGTQI